MMTRDAEKVVSVGSRAFARQSLSQVELGVDLEFVDWTCCCCSRRKGVLIMGVLFLVLSLAALVICSMAASRLSSLHMEMKNSSAATNQTEGDKGATPVVMGRKRTRAEEMNLIKGAYGVMSAQALLAAAGAGTAVTLVVGAHTSRHVLLIPWIVTASTEVLLLIGGGAYFAIGALSRVVPVVGIHGFYAFVAMVFLCVPLLYCIKIVHHLFKELRTLEPMRKQRKMADAKRKQRGHIATDQRDIRPSSPPPPPPTSSPGLPTDPAANKRPPTPPLRRSRYGSLGRANPVFENTAL